MDVLKDIHVPPADLLFKEQCNGIDFKQRKGIKSVKQRANMCMNDAVKGREEGLEVCRCHFYQEMTKSFGGRAIEEPSSSIYLT
eukprot:7502562-Ditylum_brightwellii.AAC.1